MSRRPLGVARKFVIPTDLLVELRRLAAYRGEPMAETVRVAIAEFVERQKSERPAT